MEKQANKLYLKNMLKKGLQLFTLFTILYSSSLFAQDTKLESGKQYILAKIDVTGKISYNEQTVTTFTGLEKGQQIIVPGQDISNAIKKLWKLGLFSDVNFYVNKIEGDSIFLELNINELPKLSDVKIQGIKKKKIEELTKEADLKKGKIVNENLITTTKNYFENKYKKEGYYQTKVVINTIPDSVDTEVKMVINIDKGDKVKVKNIDFEGNEQLSDAKLRKAFKNTKQRNPIRIFKKSKFIKEKYKEDLTAVIDKYKERGNRDARILSDSVIYDKSSNTLSIKVKLEEGRKYYFGDIRYLGNTVYTDNQLNSILGIKKGDVYNGTILQKRIANEKVKKDSPTAFIMHFLPPGRNSGSFIFDIRSSLCSGNILTIS